MRTRFATLLTLSLLAGSPAARAGVSSYRVTEVQPTATGARLTITFANEWGSKAENERHGSLTLYGYPDGKGGTVKSNDYKTGNYFHEGAVKLGTFKWVGTGQATVELDYAQLGLKPGAKLSTQANFFWGDHGHNWGDTEGGKPAGGPFVLPDPATAAKNSRLAGWIAPSLSRLGLGSRPRWVPAPRAPRPWLAPRLFLGPARR